MADIIAVKSAIINLLKDDEGIKSILGLDSRGQTPVYHSLIQHRIHKPCITVEDVTDTGEVSALNDAYDDVSRYEWHLAVIQIDCWSGRGAEERDQIEAAVQRCLLKGSNQASLRSAGIISIQEPSIQALDEPAHKPPLWRKCLRYRVFYILEAS